MSSQSHLYLLIEYFEGESLAKLPPNFSNVFFVRKIVDTFINIAHKINFFYGAEDLDKIKVSEDDIRFFNSVDSFKRGKDWDSCLNLYNSLYRFFGNLIKILPSAEKWKIRLQEIFTERDLAAAYVKASKDEKIVDQCKAIFNSSFLISILDRVKNLFNEIDSTTPNNN